MPKVYDLSKYLESKWALGGRGEIVDGVLQYDCWGLVRAVRHEVFNKGLLPLYALADPKNSASCAGILADQRASLARIDRAIEGAIMAMFRGGYCGHVAIIVRVDGRLAALESNSGKSQSCTWSWVDSLARKYQRVEFYD